ncbi:deoxyribose-phosphate aldolase [Corynebacterium glucuronolyticum]|uniref:Deoxyribose-phosphate aldolase n=1 Tax=Corynebacterium glucuronolyticum TaxID=39791 RepID=A0A7T4EG63_9CORY|nr:deoxyribose-phosphate aldolase [Corynebacterium glucuronolyticum]QQB46791.1 deoxyribose-phosphate aldolase [Corynebacterium glucuronolyticum]WKD62373.1 Deoxyribose-phosphate aldolase 1 [Corynebacterium glucuronolyticum DSM 44120]SMB81985.1 deoxyribose-phosphate aldolase [Corynebacterium glucuronolyticum]
MEKSKYIDHTLLAATATRTEIESLVAEAIKFDFASVCVNPVWVKTAAELLRNSTVKVCTVIGFPLGAATSKVKAFEAKSAAEEGADEVDMVINVGAALSGDWDTVESDIRSVVEATGDKVITKVILENCYLNNEQIQKACIAAKNAGADFVKTSTGFGESGAKADDVRLMRETVGQEMGVKAAGGVRTPEQFAEMVKAGATRIGTSHGAKLL